MPQNFNFPTDQLSNRSFSSSLRYRTLNNGETVVRNWLVYSIAKNAVYCFPCKLLTQSTSKLATVGYNNWVYVVRDLHDHERSDNHFAAMQSYLVRRQQSKCQTTIETVMQRNFNAEVKHWRDVLTRLISFIKFLSEHDIAIRGTGGHECLGDPKNPNPRHFLSLVELVASYDPVLSEHVCKV